MNWFEKLGRAVAEECELVKGSAIEHQCGTVWVTTDEGIVAICKVMTEEE